MPQNIDIAYNIEKDISVDEYIAVLNASGLGERRPVANRPRMAEMIRNSSVIATARHDGKLVGVARSLTDYAWTCYMNDLAVDSDYQKMGIGRELIRRTQEAIGPRAVLLLLHAPQAAEYYSHIGFTKVENAWKLERKE